MESVKETGSPTTGDYPFVPWLALDTLWFQVAGTLCNLQCTHCFVSCSPTNHRLEMLSLEQVRARLAEAVPLGVREYYFTGGEPFLNAELLPMLEETLRQGPATVLTNGVLLTAGCQPNYVYNQLNEIKPAMIQEATKNARIAAEQFSRDSQTSLGKLRNASQGWFQIENRDAATPERKVVRVVVDVDYEIN